MPFSTIDIVNLLTPDINNRLPPAAFDLLEHYRSSCDVVPQTSVGTQRKSDELLDSLISGDASRDETYHRSFPSDSQIWTLFSCDSMCCYKRAGSKYPCFCVIHNTITSTIPSDSPLCSY